MKIETLLIEIGN